MSLAIAKALLPLGLYGMLLAEHRATGYGLYCVEGPGPQLRLRPLGDVSCLAAEQIGRVGPPDLRLGARWQSSLTFYGLQFDALTRVDPSWSARRRIVNAPLAQNLRRTIRTGDYALVGSYYTVFRALLDEMNRLPVVLLNVPCRAPASLAVHLLTLKTVSRSQHFSDLLRQLLKAKVPHAGAVQSSAV